MLAQGNQGSRVRGPIASLNSLVGASPAKPRHCCRNFPSQVSQDSLSVQFSKSSAVERAPDEMGWEAKLAWPVEHEVGYFLHFSGPGQAQGELIAPAPTPGQSGAERRSRRPEKEHLLSAAPSPARRSVSSALRRAPLRAKRREAPRCTVPHACPAGRRASRPAPRARSFARHVPGCRAKPLESEPLAAPSAGVLGYRPPRPAGPRARNFPTPGRVSCVVVPGAGVRVTGPHARLGAGVAPGTRTRRHAGRSKRVTRSFFVRRALEKRPRRRSKKVTDLLVSWCRAQGCA